MTRARSRTGKRSVDPPHPPPPPPPPRQDAGCTVSLEWDRDTGRTQIVVADKRTAILLLVPVAGEKAGDAFRHPYRYLP
jgi:hypothetical protein